MGIIVSFTLLPRGEKNENETEREKKNTRKKYNKEWKKKARELVRLNRVTHKRKKRTQISKKSCTGGSVAQYEV